MPQSIFLTLKMPPFIQDETLFINEKDIENIQNKLNNVKKILLTHKSNNEIFNINEIKKKPFNLSKVKFSLKKAMDFIFNDPSIDLTSSLIIKDNTLNQEDLKHLEESTKEQNINIVTIDDKNILYLKNLITPKITKIILLSMRNNHVFLKKLSESPFFQKIKFIFIGNNRKDFKEVNTKYIISINELNLIEITKAINTNFQYEFNIYEQTT
ncbi:Hypothetical protein BCO_0096200 [Borrelia coriaceae ATCC 43381]|uniref:Uncharacterized protein n=1 Tax=Borrelia coriaceae ATCC 43381 TaxID=1408429 RepID=W5SZ64_9SPIR|nr:Hypothetical protein BCO_0096200 [Borrelia coriaceae ATCC 43381]